MNELIQFNYDSNKVRIIMKDGEPWFNASDVCKILGISNTADAVRVLDNDEKGIEKTDTLGGAQSLIFISESGLYTLIMRSNKPEAKPFQKWVTKDVLPSIRKTGQYGTSSHQLPQTFSEALQLAADQAKVIEEQQARIEADKPKVQFAEDFQAAEGNILVREMAKKLGTSQNQLFEALRKAQVLISTYEAYQQYYDRGYFKPKSGTHDQNGRKVQHTTIMITPKGQYWLWKWWNKNVVRGLL